MTTTNSNKARAGIDFRLFAGWLTASAALHALALVAIPGYDLAAHGLRPGSVQVSLSNASTSGDLAIRALNEVPALVSPDMGTSHSALDFNNALVEMPMTPLPPDAVSISSLEELFEEDARVLANIETLNEATQLEVSEENAALASTAFSEATIKRPSEQSLPSGTLSVDSLEEVFEKDAQLLASLELIDASLLDTTVPDFAFSVSSISLSPPVVEVSSPRSEMATVASFEDVLTPAVPLNEAAKTEAPLPVAKPRNISHTQPTQGLAHLDGLSDSNIESVTQTVGTDVVEGAEPHDLNALTALLHDEISRNKHYPALARRQHREGTATVSFALYPNGVIEDINVINSSGYGRLDRAARSAVSEASPFEPAVKYIDSARRFEVNVVFSLN